MAKPPSTITFHGGPLDGCRVQRFLREEETVICLSVLAPPVDQSIPDQHQTIQRIYYRQSPRYNDVFHFQSFAT